MLKFHPYSILTGDTRVEFVIYCVLRNSLEGNGMSLSSNQDQQMFSNASNPQNVSIISRNQGNFLKNETFIYFYPESFGKIIWRLISFLI